jgi:hypothetical protein
MATTPTAAPAPSAPTPVPVPDAREHHGHHRHHPAGFVPGAWAPLRVSQGIDELQLRGPGAITPVENPDPVDPAVTGSWKLVLPMVTTTEGSYGRVDQFRASSELGRLTIRSSGEFSWEVPGRTRSSGALTEVTASEASSADHFWSLDGNGQTLVIAPGEDGSLILYDAASNRFYARAIQD